MKREVILGLRPKVAWGLRPRLWGLRPRLWGLRPRLPGACAPGNDPDPKQWRGPMAGPERGIMHIRQHLVVLQKGRKIQRFFEQSFNLHRFLKVFSRILWYSNFPVISACHLEVPACHFGAVSGPSLSFPRGFGSQPVTSARFRVSACHFSGVSGLSLSFRRGFETLVLQKGRKIRRF